MNPRPQKLYESEAPFEFSFFCFTVLYYLELLSAAFAVFATFCFCCFLLLLLLAFVAFWFRCFRCFLLSLLLLLLLLFPIASFLCCFLLFFAVKPSAIQVTFWHHYAYQFDPQNLVRGICAWRLSLLLSRKELYPTVWRGSFHFWLWASEPHLMKACGLVLAHCLCKKGAASLGTPAMLWSFPTCDWY